MKDEKIEEQNKASSLFRQPATVNHLDSDEIEPAVVFLEEKSALGCDLDWLCSRPHHLKRLILSAITEDTHVEGADELVIDDHHGSRIVELTTIMRSGEDGDKPFVGEEFIAILDNLMSSGDQIDL